jgi:hypothetical protein
MGILCTFGFHAWDGCKCKRCGIEKDTTAEDDKWFKAIGATPDGPDYFIFDGSRFARSSEVAKALLFVRDMPSGLLEVYSQPQNMVGALERYAEKGFIDRPRGGIFYPYDYLVEVCVKAARIRKGAR